MARRRRRRNSDLDLVKLIVGGIFLMSFVFTKNLEAALKLSFAVLIFCGAVAGLAVYLRSSGSQVGSASIERLRKLYRRGRLAGEGSQVGSASIERSRKPYRRGRLVGEGLQVGSASIERSPTTEMPLDWSLELIRSLDWKRFEELCAGYFQAKGRKAQVTDLGADGGIDVLLFGDNDPEKILGVVQCKAWAQKPVGVREIRELLGVMTDVGCPLGVYVTTSGYTPDAKAFAEGKHIKLMDAGQLLALIQELPMESRTELLQRTTLGDFTTPSCPSCGIKLVSRTSRKGNNAGQSFWGCRNFPRCRYTMRRAKST